MRRAALLLAAAAAAAAAAAVGPEPNTVWDLVLLKDAVPYGAMCIDGSPAAYYVKWGVGEDANKWILFWEGGGWCTSLESCLSRSKTPLGSSKSYPQQTTSYSARDVLMPNCTTNPTFCRYTTVYSPYCDGQSRSGNLAEPAVVNGTSLYFRGYKVVQAVISQLLMDPLPGSRPPAGTLLNASHLLISGSSAGGLTTALHADFVNDAVKRAGNGAAKIAAVPEVGFFIDGASIWGGEHIMTEAYKRAVDMANITGGASDQVNSGCLDAYRAHDPSNAWKCFMAQYNYPFLRTPTFVVNSKYDEWQLSNILAPNPNWSFDVSPYAPWQPCIAAPSTGCNATQYAQFQNYSAQFMAALNTSRAGLSPAQAAQNGGIITSCDIHTTLIGGLSHRIAVDGMTLYQAISNWWTGNYTPSSEGYWTIDGTWPNNPTCAGPHVEAVRAMAKRIDW